MFLNKATWIALQNYSNTQFTTPLLPCPFCQNVELKLEEDSIQYREIRNNFNVANMKFPLPEDGLLKSLAKLTESYIEANSRRSQFVAFFVCQHCQVPVSVTGKTKLYEKSEGPPRLNFVYFLPAVNLFELNKAYPENVKSEMTKSFTAFFSDPTAAGSRLRTSIEFLLDEQGVQKFRVTKGGEIQKNKDGGHVKLPLGDRLKLFSESDPELGAMLGAVKALGNEATHGADLQSEELLDAYDLVEHVLVELYVTRPQRTKLLVRSDKMKQKYR